MNHHSRSTNAVADEGQARRAPGRPAAASLLRAASESLCRPLTAEEVRIIRGGMPDAESVSPA